MRNSFAFKTARQTEREITPDFLVVLLYQDFASGIRAKEFFDWLATGHRTVFRFLCHLWKFDLLQVPQLRERTAQEAAQADMIVIAARSETELPPAARGWIEKWLRRTKVPGAVVALLDGPQSHGGPIRQYLSQVAARGRMRFFCPQVPSPGMKFAALDNNGTKGLWAIPAP